jgi:DNA-binding SARP family transcriptional activator/tetratricopeptide (TPR) repeat protein
MLALMGECTVDEPIRLQVLGPVEIRGRDTSPRLPGPQLRLLLGVLALSAGQVVPIGELVDALWEDRPPQSARASLQILAARLRKALADVPDCAIERHGDGYRLHVGADLVDVRRFRALVQSARAAADHEDAAALLGQALVLWRGPALADVPATTVVETIRAGLAEEQLSAVQDRFEHLLAGGHDAEAAAEIPLLLSKYPLSERLAGMLMLAWYRRGRQADALQMFRDLRARLADELGIEPGAELQRLHQQILTGDPALGAAQTPHQPADPPVVTNLEAARQLPAPPALFTGRDEELRSLTAWLDEDAAAEEPITLAISGAPGIGKTALALRWAHQMQQRFPDGQLYLNLRGFDASLSPVTPAEAIGSVLESLGLNVREIPPRLDARASLYRSLLAGRRMLIVLDNARDEAQVRPLLPGSPSCAVLITGRNELTGLIAAEGARPLVLDALAPDESRQFLARRLGVARAAAEPEAIVELTSLCSHLPLALAITAARAATRPAFSLASIAATLRSSHNRLDALDIGDQSTNVRAVFSWSFRLLSDEAAQMFRLLGAFPVPDTPVAAAANLAAVSVPSAQTALSELVRANLVQELIPGRYTMHDLLRVYATGLGDEERLRAALQRALDYYLHTAQAAISLAYPATHLAAIKPAGPDSTAERLASAGQANAWLQAEHRNLLTAAEIAADNGLDAYACQLPAVLGDYLTRRGHYLDLAQSQQIALAAATRAGDDIGLSYAHRGLGEALIQLGSPDEAQHHLQRALNLYQRLGDRAEQGRCYCGLARLAGTKDDHSLALRRAQQALRLYRAVGDQAGQAAALNGIGWDYALLGDSKRAQSYCTKALELHRQTGNRLGEATTLDSLGYCSFQLGNYRHAIALYRQALGAYADVGDHYYRAQTLVRLGETHLAEGEPQAARTAWEQALQVLESLHHNDAGPVQARLQDLTVLASNA